jgi:hypothetical protein
VKRAQEPFLRRGGCVKEDRGHKDEGGVEDGLARTSRNLKTRWRGPYTFSGGERGPVTPPVFKAGDTVLCGSNGGFDFHTPPPQLLFNPVRTAEVREP